MFQDTLFVHANRDIVQDVQYELANLEPPVREGILLGCKKAGYDSDIADLIIEWEQAGIKEDPDNTVISLYQYIAKYSNQNDDFREILQSAVSNQSLVALIGRDTIQEYGNGERKGGITLNIGNVTNLGNMQITEKGDNYLVMDDQGIDRNVLLAQIVGLQTKLDNDLYTEESYEALLSHLDYEFAQYRDLNKSNEYNRLNNSFEEVKAEKEEAESKDKLKKFLSVASSIVSLVTATPKVIELVSKVVNHIGNIFK